MYIYRIAKGKAAKEAFNEMFEKEKEWQEKTNEKSLFLSFKRYQILSTVHHAENIEDVETIQEHFEKYKLRKNCLGCFLLTNNKFQFTLPYQVDYS